MKQSNIENSDILELYEFHNSLAPSKTAQAEIVKPLLQRITGSALVRQCCKAHAKMNRKMGNSTPCKIVTPKNFILKLCTRDDVGDVTRHANVDCNRYSAASPQIGEILKPCAFF